MYKNNFLNNVKKFKLIYNNKEPAVGWRNKNNLVLNVDLNKNNVGIPCGEINNLIVLDIDNKDDGIEEFNTYIEKYGIINTLTVKSAGDGYHYYFTYEHKSESSRHLIQNSLTNSSKYRKKGIDIRTNGGYIVAPDSSINGKKYIIINDIEPVEMPEQLILWILENKNCDKEIINTNDQILKKNIKKITEDKKTILETNDLNEYYYDITNDQLTNILDKLDSSWYDDYDKWLIILTILKSLNNFKIFDDFSKKSKKYNYDSNLKIWNYNSGCIDINYLILKINKEQKLNLPLVEKCKLMQKVKIPVDIKQITINNKHLEIDSDIFFNYDTIIIKSDTGTGKTTHTARQLDKYLKNNNYQFISLVNLINLSNEQLKTFTNENVKINSYLNDDIDYIDDNFIICINSLTILELMDDDYFENKIIYIDEINYFLENLTHNSLLDKNIKLIYELLIKFLKKAHKIIVSDATILNNVFDFFKFRNKDKCIMITNEYQKYKNTKAIKVQDENLFYEKITNDIVKNKYFLFACDSCEIITKIFLKFQKDYPDKAKDMILITSATKFKIINANEDFKNKWVFHSPSIVTGVDFSIELKQNQYVYIKGNSISPASIYQQTTRNRNINKLYYYIDVKSKTEKYSSFDNVKENYKKLIEINQKINNICKQFDDKEDCYINENMFFNLFCYNEYILDIYNTNKRLHYEFILKERGFILEVEGSKKKLDKVIKKNMDEIYNNTNLVNEYLNDSEENKKKKLKYYDLVNNIKTFNLKTKEEIEKYKDLLNDKYKIQHFFNYIKLFNYDGMTKENKNTYDVKSIISTNEKVKIIHKLYKDHNIKYLSLDEFEKIKKINITDEEYIYIKKLFRCVKHKPQNNVEFKYFMIGILKNIIGKLDIIEKIIKYDKYNNKNMSYELNIINKNLYDFLHQKIKDKQIPQYFFNF